MSHALIRCWRFSQVSRSLRVLFLDRLASLRRLPRRSDWVLDVSPGAVLPLEITNSIVAKVQTPRMKASARGRYFALVPGRIPLSGCAQAECLRDVS